MPTHHAETLLQKSPGLVLTVRTCVGNPGLAEQECYRVGADPVYGGFPFACLQEVGWEGNTDHSQCLAWGWGRLVAFYA